jgi:hypothetical protein
MSVLQVPVLPLELNVSVLRHPCATSGPVCPTAQQPLMPLELFVIQKVVLPLDMPLVPVFIQQQAVLPMKISVLQQPVLPLDLSVIQKAVLPL